MSELSYIDRVRVRFGKLRNDGNHPSATDTESLFHRTALLYASLEKEAALRPQYAKIIRRIQKGMLNIMPARVRRSPFEITTYASTLSDYEVSDVVDAPGELVRI